MFAKEKTVNDKRKHDLLLTCLGIVVAGMGASDSNGQEAMLLSEAHAFRPVLIQIVFDVAHPSANNSSEKPQIAYIGGAFRPEGAAEGKRPPWAHGHWVDGDGYAHFDVRPHGNPRATVLDGKGVAVFPIMAMCQEIGAGEFLFPTAGRYHLRWRVTMHDPESKKFVIEQTIDIEDSKEVDVEFLRRVGSRDFYEHILRWSEDVINRMPEFPETPAEFDLYSAPVGITLLTYAAGKVDYISPVSDRERRIVQERVKIAQDFPDSAYSPYVMYMAGSFAVRDVEDTIGPKWPASCADIRKHELYKQARDYLRFAIEHGDPYLKPRAQVRLAFLKTMGGLFDEAKRRLDAVETTIGGRVITTAINKMREDVLKAEARYKEFKQKHDKGSR